MNSQKNRSGPGSANNRSAIIQKTDLSGLAPQPNGNPRNSSSRQNKSRGPTQGSAGAQGGYQPSLHFVPG